MIGDAIRIAIRNRFSAILLYCDSTLFFASHCGISGDSRPAILGIARFAIRDSVPPSSVALHHPCPLHCGQNYCKNVFNYQLLQSGHVQPQQGTEICNFGEGSPREFPEFSPVDSSLVRKSPQNVEKMAQFPGGENGQNQLSHLEEAHGSVNGAFLTMVRDSRPSRG